jgi:hypothetical protein
LRGERAGFHLPRLERDRAAASLTIPIPVPDVSGPDLDEPGLAQAFNADFWDGYFFLRC